MTDEYQGLKVSDARAVVQASGLLEGIEGPHFSVGDPGAFGAFLWAPAFRASEKHSHPDFARVTITRQGQKPREVVISWDEYTDEMESPEWDAIRAKKPMAVFGGEAEKHAYRVVFADVLAEALPPRIVLGGDVGPLPKEHGRMRVIPDDRPAAGWDLPPRDWFAEVKATPDAVTLNALFDEAKAAGALRTVDGLQQAIMDRTLDLQAVKAPTPTPRPEGQGRRRRGRRS